MQRPFPLIEVYKGLCGDAGLGVLDPTAYYSNGLRRVLAAEMKHMTFIDTVFHFRGGVRAAVCVQRCAGNGTGCVLIGCIRGPLKLIP